MKIIVREFFKQYNIKNSSFDAEWNEIDGMCIEMTELMQELRELAELMGSSSEEAEEVVHSTIGDAVLLAVYGSSETNRLDVSKVILPGTWSIIEANLELLETKIKKLSNQKPGKKRGGGQRGADASDKSVKDRVEWCLKVLKSTATEHKYVAQYINKLTKMMVDIVEEERATERMMKDVAEVEEEDKITVKNMVACIAKSMLIEASSPTKLEARKLEARKSKRRFIWHKAKCTKKRTKEMFAKYAESEKDGFKGFMERMLINTIDVFETNSKIANRAIKNADELASVSCYETSMADVGEAPIDNRLNIRSRENAAARRKEDHRTDQSRREQDKEQRTLKNTDQVAREAERLLEKRVDEMLGEDMSMGIINQKWRAIFKTRISLGTFAIERAETNERLLEIQDIKADGKSMMWKQMIESLLVPIQSPMAYDAMNNLSLKSKTRTTEAKALQMIESWKLKVTLEEIGDGYFAIKVPETKKGWLGKSVIDDVKEVFGSTVVQVYRKQSSQRRDFFWRKTEEHQMPSNKAKLDCYYNSITKHDVLFTKNQMKGRSKRIKSVIRMEDVSGFTIICVPHSVRYVTQSREGGYLSLE